MEVEAPPCHPGPTFSRELLAPDEDSGSGKSSSRNPTGSCNTIRHRLKNDQLSKTLPRDNNIQSGKSHMTFAPEIQAFLVKLSLKADTLNCLTEHAKNIPAIKTNSLQTSKWSYSLISSDISGSVSFSSHTSHKPHHNSSVLRAFLHAA